MFRARVYGMPRACIAHVHVLRNTDTQPEGRPLRLVDRSERAILHEEWSEADWRRRWAIGPSAPPPDRPAYALLEVCVITTGLVKCMYSARGMQVSR